MKQINARDIERQIRQLIDNVTATSGMGELQAMEFAEEVLEPLLEGYSMRKDELIQEASE